MFRIGACIATALVISAVLLPSLSEAQTTTKKFSRAHLKEIMVKWKQNRPKLAACRKEAKVKGLAGDDRWIFVGDCMGKS